MRFIEPSKAKTKLEKKTFKATEKIMTALKEDFESMEDVEAAMNALITTIAYYSSILSRNELEVLDIADRVKSSMISYYVHVTKE